MRITEILKSDKPTVSFEVFPPKTSDSFSAVAKAVDEIAAMNPSYMSVTYGAGGGTSRYTLDIAREISEKYGVPSVAHLTCVSSSRESVKSRIEDFKAAGIENVLALRGDIPAERLNEDRSGWDYNHATELIADLKESGADFCIGGACYPEVHPESGSRKEDILHLKEKTDAGCEFLTTQMFFDNSLFYAFLYRIREAGINVPIIPGIMPITNANQVARAIKLSGSFMPQRFSSIVDRFGSSPQAMMQAGIAYATDQIIDLFANNINHIHIYSMNKPQVASAIMRNLSEIIK